MIATFFITYNDKNINESEVVHLMDTIRQSITSVRYFEGGIILSNDDQKAVFEDELEPIVIGFLFNLPIELINYGEAIHHFFSYDSDIFVSKIDNKVRFTSELTKPFESDFIETVCELYKCGVRYIDFIRSVDPEYFELNIKLLEEYRANTLAELSKIGAMP